MGSPIVLEARGPANVAPGATVDVVVLVRRQGDLVAPVTLEVRLPPGAHLVSGVLVESLPDPGVQGLTRTFRVTIGAVPADDVVAVASAQGTGWGARAEASYRFGRPEPRLPDPARRDEVVLPGGRSLGAPVTM